MNVQPAYVSAGKCLARHCHCFTGNKPGPINYSAIFIACHRCV